MNERRGKRENGGGGGGGGDGLKMKEETIIWEITTETLHSPLQKKKETQKALKRVKKELKKKGKLKLKRREGQKVK